MADIFYGLFFKEGHVARPMKFIWTKDLDPAFYDAHKHQIQSGPRAPTQHIVWDIDKQSFRTFNQANQVGKLHNIGTATYDPQTVRYHYDIVGFEPSVIYQQ